MRSKQGVILKESIGRAGRPTSGATGTGLESPRESMDGRQGEGGRKGGREGGDGCGKWKGVNFVGACTIS